MPSSHDQNFKNLVLDYPREALALFAPEQAACLDDGVVFTPLREEQLKDRLSDRFLELDIPLLLEWPDGRREALLFVVEQHTDPARFSVHKLGRYCLSLAELLKTDRVVPVVVFLRQANKVPAQIVLGNEIRDYITVNYIRCVLPELDGERYIDSNNLVARLNLLNMRWPQELKLAMYASAVRGLMSLEQHPDRRVKYSGFIDIYADLTNNERRLFELHYQEEGRVMAGFAERFESIGLEKGLQRGMQQGMQQGMQRGLEEGSLRARRETATNLMRMTTLDDAAIAAATGLSLEEVQRLRSDN